MKCRIFYLALVNLFILLMIGNHALYAQVPQPADITGKTNAMSHEKKKASKDSTKAKSKGAFVPVPFIVTDQNFGYGAILALGYMHANKNSDRKDTPPSVTGIAGGGTSTKSWTIGLMHSHSWNSDHLRYFGGLLYVNFNLDFYSIGSIDLSDHPIKIKIEGGGTMQRVTFRLKESNFFIGPQYTFAKVTAGIHKDQDFIFDRIDTLRLAINGTQFISGIGLLFNFDSRDNTLSPNKGLYGGLEFNYNGQWMGSSSDYTETDIYFYAYLPITNWLYSIYHFDAQSSGGDVPFYLKPFVELRGAPALRYQGNNTLLLEAQFRGYFYKEIALDVFGGIGNAFDSFSEFSSAQYVYNYGVGLRYELKKAFGTRVGVDFAWANGQFGWYIIIGTAI